MKLTQFVLAIAVLIGAGLALPVHAESLPVSALGEIDLPSEPVFVRVRPGTQELWASLQDGSIAILNPKTKRVLATIPDVGAGAWGLAFHPDGKEAYGTNWMANELVIIDAKRRKIESKINVGLKPAFVSVAPEGDRLWVTNFFSGELSTVDLENQRNLGDTDVGRRPMGLAVDHIRKVAYLGSGAAGLLTTLDLTSGEVIGTREIQFASTHNLSLSADGSVLVAAGAPNSLLVFDPRDPQSEVKKIPVGRDPVGAIVGPAGRYAFVSNYQDSTISVVDLQLGAQIDTIPTGDAPMFLALDPAGKNLFVAGNRAKAISVFAVGDEKWGLLPTAAAASGEPTTAR